MRFHIVDSVKGGSGKSTCALSVAASIKNFANRGKVGAAGRTFKGSGEETAELTYEKWKRAKPIIVDVDLLGTSWEQQFENCIIFQDRVYLNDLIKDYTVNSQTAFRQLIQYKTSEGSSLEKQEIILCNPNSSEKRKYKASSASGYVREIQYTQFRHALIKLIDWLRDENYTDIVFDMPPNSDSYSDMVFDILLSTQEKSFRSKDRLFVYLTTAVNRSHFWSNMDWLNSVYTAAPSRYWNVNRIQPLVVINDTANYFDAKTFGPNTLDSIMNAFLVKHPEADEWMYNRLFYTKKDYAQLFAAAVGDALIGTGANPYPIVDYVDQLSVFQLTRLSTTVTINLKALWEA